MNPWRVAELRAIALMRARLIPLAATGVGVLALTAARGTSLPDDMRTEAVLQLMFTGAFLITLIVAHGMVAGELRSGVALLWLQKPVRPVAFYSVRGVEVTVTATLLVAALCGGSALVLLLVGAPEASRAALDATPVLLVISIWFCAMIFGFSGWGLPLDSLLVVLFCIGSLYWVVSRLIPGGDPAGLPFFLPPMDDLRVLMDALAGQPVAGVARALLKSVGFVALWAAVGCAGLFVTTRSPLPTEVSR